ncbi:type I-B CRISPR-associated protein Cas7/Cst2/DevR [Streptomyces alboniger]|uniref:Type I-B CRISPR-associated protein Cas7/Cst2/DevR n=1 Tax=Streptomyces alboniger TaxID=132473 RepID=A0A5J6HAB7_STRAD|nr:type I-B CRISPR-associated protein Cas7/Cst2/DevR [Streptomyces alboniger]QEV16558.1 type I-B CRISPR-associated protein Cas7/Cst2/DevR [Streptomyces alboniger]
MSVYLTGKAVLDIQAGAPNNGRGTADQGNVTPVKQHRTGGKTYPYGSAQWWRRMLRDSFPDTDTPSPIIINGKDAKQQSYTSGRPDRHTDDDLFGYMAATKSAQHMRDTVLSTGTFVSVAPERPTRDFCTMSRGLPTGANPILHEHEFYTAALQGDLRLDLLRVGFFEQEGRVRKAALSDEAVKEALRAGCVEVTRRGNTGILLPIEERRRRVGLLLRTLASMHGGASGAAHYGDRTPALILLAPIQGGNQPFTRILAPVEGEIRFFPDTLREEIAAWADVLDGTVHLGWAPGFLGDQRESARAELDDLITAGRLIIDHPRVVLTNLAQAIETGHHDTWFQD